MNLRPRPTPPALPPVIRDFFLPAALTPEDRQPVERSGVAYEAARWSPRRFASLMEHLSTGGRAALASLDKAALLEAWQGTVESFLDPSSPERRGLSQALARLCRLSPEGLDAGLDAVLGGVRGEAAGRLFAEAERLKAAAWSGPVVVLLAANLPALAVQPLLPALALRRPVLLKSPSAEPLFTPAFLSALAGREPRLGEAVAAATWSGGDPDLEAPVLAAAGRVVAYGEQETLDDLARRAPGKVLGYGPKTSLAVVGARATSAAVAEGLARDIALFDQRGCLSVAAVYTAGDAVALADRLAVALEHLAERWPPGPPDLAAAAAVRQVREEAILRGLHRPRLRPHGLPEDSLAAGTVMVEPRPGFRPSPGLRTVRIHPLADLRSLPTLLGPWQGRLQGAALAGGDAWALAPALAELGVSRAVAPGRLQSPDSTWHNGGLHPLTALGR